MSLRVSRVLVLGACSLDGRVPGQRATVQAAVSSAVAQTQQAQVATPTPRYPYSPLSVAQLLDPGPFFGGEWESRGVADLNQPLSSTCGYFGGCFEGWPGPPVHGALLALRFLERDLGWVAFVFYADKQMTAQAFEAACGNYGGSSGYSRLPAGDLAEEAFTFSEYIQGARKICTYSIPSWNSGHVIPSSQSR